MSNHQVHIFISHSWAHSGHYETLAQWVFQENWSVGSASLDFRNFSVPKDNPIHNAASDKALKEAIYNQISKSHIVVIPTGMYATHSKWIGKEIEGANYYSKRILAVNPQAQERKSAIVTDSAHKTVGWTKQSVVSAIWELYRTL